MIRLWEVPTRDRFNELISLFAIHDSVDEFSNEEREHAVENSLGISAFLQRGGKITLPKRVIIKSRQVRRLTQANALPSDFAELSDNDNVEIYIRD